MAARLVVVWRRRSASAPTACWPSLARSEEHTSELQSRLHLVCRLLLEKKKKTKKRSILSSHNRFICTASRISASSAKVPDPSTLSTILHQFLVNTHQHASFPYSVKQLA